MWLKIAIRTLRRNALYSGINILGLAIGIAGCITIFLIVSHEYRFDRYRTDRDRVYRIYSEFSGNFEGTNPGVPKPMGPYMRTLDLGATIVAPIRTEESEVRIVNSPKAFDVEQIVFADEAYFQLFPDYQWLSGTPGSSLANPQQVVLTESQAQKYFGTLPASDIVGRELVYFDSIEVTISGIVADPKQPTDLRFTDFISSSTLALTPFKYGNPEDEWGNYSSSNQLWIKLGENQTPASVEATLERVEAHEQALISDPYISSNFNAAYRLQSFADFHFNMELGTFNNGRRPVNRRVLLLLMLVAGSLLLMAIVNFVNLETAQSTRRAMEIGVRKVLGSGRGPLIRQFLGEAFVVTLLAVILGLALSLTSLYLFDEFIDEDVAMDLTDWRLILFLMGLLGLVPVLAGFYPAWNISQYRPIIALRNQIQSGRSRAALVRRMLIVGQFALAQLFLFITLTYSQQLQYMLNKDLGLATQGILMVSIPWGADSLKTQTLLREVRRLPGVKRASGTQDLPIRRGFNRSMPEFYTDSDTLTVETNMQRGDTAFVPTYGMQLLAGRNYRQVNNQREVVVNESFMRAVGIEHPQELINRSTSYGTIVGVVANFHVRSLENPYEPTMLLPPNLTNHIALKLAESPSVEHLQTLERVNKLAAGIMPNDVPNTRFFEDQIAGLYDSQTRTAKLASTATLLAVIIACIGLLGLISYSVVQRTKEIGIRKVLGATVSQIIGLLAKDFVRLVLVAALVALPLGYYIIEQLLQDYAFRISISWWFFVGTTSVALLLCLVTIGLRSYATARLNPAESLRRE